MKYQCSNCKTVFNIPTKEIIVDLSHPNITREIAVCPSCNTLSFTEYDEPKPEISSVVSVDLSQVDGYLAKGYVVHELYAKTATLKKLKNPDNPVNCTKTTLCEIEKGARGCAACAFNLEVKG